jgi:hypothetical protein
MHFLLAVFSPLFRRNEASRMLQLPLSQVHGSMTQDKHPGQYLNHQLITIEDT